MNRVGPLPRIAIVFLALAAGWAALWLARARDEEPRTSSPSPSALVAGEAPQRFGTVYLCAFDSPYRAYSARGYHFYPPNHPLLPQTDERPDRCFASAKEAEAAGYTAALPPQGSRDLDGVYLVPESEFDPDGTFWQACLEAARRLGFAVPCPHLLPNPRQGVDPPRCGAPGEFFPTRPPCVLADTVFLLQQSGFAVPPGYGLGGVGGGASLVIAAYPVGKGVLGGGYEPYYANFVLCPQARPLERIPLDRSLDRTSPVRGELLACAGTESALDGYLILRWEEGGTVYQVALLGDTQTNRDLLSAISAGIELVEPIPVRPAP